MIKTKRLEISRPERYPILNRTPSLAAYHIKVEIGRINYPLCPIGSVAQDKLPRHGKIIYKLRKLPKKLDLAQGDLFSRKIFLNMLLMNSISRFFDICFFI